MYGNKVNNLKNSKSSLNDASQHFPASQRTHPQVLNPPLQQTLNFQSFLSPRSKATNTTPQSQALSPTTSSSHRDMMPANIEEVHDLIRLQFRSLLHFQGLLKKANLLGKEVLSEFELAAFLKKTYSGLNYEQASALTKAIKASSASPLLHQHSPSYGIHQDDLLRYLSQFTGKT